MILLFCGGVLLKEQVWYEGTTKYLQAGVSEQWTKKLTVILKKIIWYKLFLQKL